MATKKKKYTTPKQNTCSSRAFGMLKEVLNYYPSRWNYSDESLHKELVNNVFESEDNPANIVWRSKK